MNTKQQADEWIRTVARQHLGANIRRFTWNGYYGQKAIGALLGTQSDFKPVTGTAVAENDDFVLLKLSPNDFFGVSKGLLSEPVAVGSKVQVTPYARRRFDGQPLYAPTKVEQGEAGCTISTYIIGESKSYIPVDKESIVCQELKDMIDVIERERADELRTVAQVLVDAGAWMETPTVRDVLEEEDIIDKPPTVTFRVSSTKADGRISVIYDRAMDSFDLVLMDLDGKELVRQDNIYITPEGPSELGAATMSMVDDGLWRIAKVEVLKKAKQVKAVTEAA
jgi:hypothetical protein